MIIVTRYVYMAKLTLSVDTRVVSAPSNMRSDEASPFRRWWKPTWPPLLSRFLPLQAPLRFCALFAGF